MKTSTLVMLGIAAFVLYEISQGKTGLAGLGRVYLSGMGGMNGLGGLGMIGQGYNINEQHGGDASAYEKAIKYTM